MTGTPTSVENAKQALTEKIAEMEKEKEDRLLRFLFHISSQFLFKINV